MRRDQANRSTIAVGGPGPFLAEMILAGFLLGQPGTAHAQVVNDFWGGNASTSYGNAANWTNGIVPNNGTPAGTTYNVFITNTMGNLGAVTNGFSPTISSLTVGTATGSLNFLTVSDNNSLTIAGGPIVNFGQLNLNSAGSTTQLVISGSVSLSGGGTLSMSNQSGNQILAASGSTLTNVDNLIQGSGTIGVNGNLTLVNQALGEIVANQLTALNINASNVTNSGLIEAIGGGTLNLLSVVNNSNGSIQSVGAGSVVDLAGSAISGGTLTTTSGGVMNSGNSILSGVTISSGSTLSVQSSTATLQGTVVNNGTIAISSAVGSSAVLIDNGATLNNTGGGVITMTNQLENSIQGNGGTLINDTGDTIQGSGNIGVNGESLAVINKGTIDANQSIPLTIAVSVPVTNTGTLEATAGGTLAILSTINNAGGTIESVGAGSVVNLSGGVINGGTLTTTSGGAMYSGGGTLDGVTITAGSTVTTQDSTSTSLQQTITNNGTILVNSVGGSTALLIDGSVTVNGTGSITMSNQSSNSIDGQTGTPILTNGAGHTIQGAGQINSLSLINNGTVLANQSNAGFRQYTVATPASV
jgi:hypothetical protein